MTPQTLASDQGPHRRRATRPAWSLALSLLLGAGLVSPTVAAEMPRVDHHMHLRSPEASRVAKLNCEKLGPVKCPPLTSKDPSNGADALAALDKAGISQGVFGSPNYADLHLDVAKETRTENRFVVEQAHLSCGRLFAFIGVDPLSPNALNEIA
jgi:hypothetical protein